MYRDGLAMAGCFHQLKIDYCVPVDEKKRDKSLREVEPLEKIRKAIRNVISILQRLPLTRAKTNSVTCRSSYRSSCYRIESRTSAGPWIRRH